MQRLKSQRAVTPRLAAQQDERVLARWLTQISQDKTGIQFQRMTRETAYGVIYLEMQQLGAKVRQEAYAVLTGGYYIDPRTAPPTNRTALITAAVVNLYGIEIIGGAGLNTTPDNVLFAGFTRPPFAWIETFARMHDARVPRPVMHVTNASDPMRTMMFWDMACTLGRFVKDQADYHHGLADQILPPDPHLNRTMTPLVHAFARAFFNYGNECPIDARCSCLGAQMELARVPDGLLPQPTVPVSTQALRQEIQRQTTPPPGLRWQEWRDQQLKRTNQELRGLTPPPKSGEL